METGRDWHEKIHDALWAYRTTIRTPTNATPSELVYGTEVVLPLHVQKPALKFASLLQLPLDQYQQQRLVQLDLLLSSQNFSRLPFLAEERGKCFPDSNLTGFWKLF